MIGLIDKQAGADGMSGIDIILTGRGGESNSTTEKHSCDFNLHMKL